MRVTAEFSGAQYWEPSGIAAELRARRTGLHLLWLLGAEHRCWTASKARLTWVGLRPSFPRRSPMGSRLLNLRFVFPGVFRRLMQECSCEPKNYQSFGPSGPRDRP